MLLLNRQIKSIVLILILSFVGLPLMAAKPNKTNKKKSTSSRKYASKRSSMKSKTIKLVQTDHFVNVKTEEGGQITLPKVEQIVEDQFPTELYADNTDASHFSIGSINSTPAHLLRLEMHELSTRLGVKIADEEHLDLYREAADWLGTRYRRGGMSRSSVDCSGFTNIIYNTVFKTKLPRVSTQIAKEVKESISNIEDLTPGDLVFFSTFRKKYINHVGVYIGDGHFVHASIKKGVIVSSLKEGYYKTAFRKGGRM